MLKWPVKRDASKEQFERKYGLKSRVLPFPGLRAYIRRVQLEGAMFTMGRLDRLEKNDETFIATDVNGRSDGAVAAKSFSEYLMSS